MTVQIRQIRPSDYHHVISVVDSWWDGRHMADMLPRLFFEHFTDTSFAAERDGELAGFLVGLLSQSRPGEAYIHFVGVHPAERGRGLGRQLYQHFFAAAQARGAGLVRAVSGARVPGHRGKPLLRCAGGAYDRSVVTAMPAWREVRLLVARALGEIHLPNEPCCLPPPLGI
jgi:GNAT superfamily N-acetyltransferase